VPDNLVYSAAASSAKETMKYICAKGKTQRKPPESLKVRRAFKVGPSLTPSAFAFSPVKA
jgi:hypothetical protein